MPAVSRDYSENRTISHRLHELKEILRKDLIRNKTIYLLLLPSIIYYN